MANIDIDRRRRLYLFLVLLEDEILLIWHLFVSSACSGVVSLKAKRIPISPAHSSLVILTARHNKLDYSFSPCIIAGEYSCLKVDLLFRREFSYYLITIYIPCCMLVIVSWVSFWLDANAVPARVSLGVTTLLTRATQTTGINNSLPPVTYTTVRSSLFISGL